MYYIRHDHVCMNKKGNRNEGVKGSLIQNMKNFYLYIKFDINIIKNGSFCISLEMIDL
jgi:hypothetical protein